MYHAICVFVSVSLLKVIIYIKYRKLELMKLMSNASDFDSKFKTGWIDKNV